MWNVKHGIATAQIEVYKSQPQTPAHIEVYKLQPQTTAQIKFIKYNHKPRRK